MSEPSPEPSGTFQTRVHGDVGMALTVARMEGGVHQHQHFHGGDRRLISFPLPAPEVDRIRRAWVRTASAEPGRRILVEFGLLALLGPHGSGRRTSAIGLLAELEVPVHELTLDHEDLGKDLPDDGACGFILHLDDVADTLRPEFGAKLVAHVGPLRRRGSYVIATCESDTWGRLGLAQQRVDVTVVAPDPQAVFETHLGELVPGIDARAWLGHQELARSLSDVSAEDAVRAVVLAQDALDRARIAGGDAPNTDHVIADTLAALQNWAEPIGQWFTAHGGLAERTAMVAAAALEGASITSIIRAEEMLLTRIGAEPPAGAALIGPDAATLAGRIDADLDLDSRLRFQRPSFGVAVIDHLWRNRPQLRSPLIDWLVELPTVLPVEDGRPAVDTVVRLATDHHESSVLTDAATTWSKRPECRPHAVRALADGGTHPVFGGRIRRWLYDNITRASRQGGDSLQVAIAEVCGTATFGLRYPQVAMTRLRHASRRESDVRKAVVEAFRGLVAEPGLRTPILRELGDWLKRPPGRQRSTALDALLALLSMRRDGRSVVMPDSVQAAERIELLAHSLRVLLRDADPVEDAYELVCEWLEATARGQLDVDVAIAVLVSASKSTVDTSHLLLALRRWLHRPEPGSDDGTEPDPDQAVPRAQVAERLRREIDRTDPVLGGPARPVGVDRWAS